ncbi:MAG: hypothetical protein PHV82_06275 [Victivallaceae bacterium]|nr:hypothetical protein [Victivallaceae bacterium]
MKKKIILAAAVLTAVNVFFPAAIRADEKTGREIKEVLGDLTEELNAAQQKVAKIEEERISYKNAAAQNLLPERAQALKDLEKLSNRYHEEKSPEERTKLAKQVESKILKTSELGTDFVETMKNDLLYQDKQLAVIQEPLSGVILKMEKLAVLTAKNDKGLSALDAKLRARQSLQNLAKMVEVLAKKHNNSQQWGSVRNTIMLQDKLLRYNSLAHGKIELMLENQKKLYEQVLSQVIVARSGLKAERQTLLQITISDLAKFILRKTANLHLGSQSVLQIGKIAFQDSVARQQKLESYMNQDQDIGLTINSGEDVSSQTASSDVSAEYEKYLNSSIN